MALFCRFFRDYRCADFDRGKGFDRIDGRRIFCPYAFPQRQKRRQSPSGQKLGRATQKREPHSLGARNMLLDGMLWEFDDS
jgi:hypothetical protein